MRRKFQVAKKEITFYTGTVDGIPSLAYSEDICGKKFLFWAQTNRNLPANTKEAVQYIESLGWEINQDGDFIEN